MTANESVILRYAMITPVQKPAGDEIKYNKLPNNTETQHENAKEENTNRKY